MITRILVANRGEIARRVFATARRLGIETVAVHSDADAGLPFVADADYVVRLPGNSPAETYLRGVDVIAAAQRTGANAIHPGYGFLSENAEFAAQVEAAGLIWIGPAPDSITTMGDKIRAKALMAAAGVPVLDNLTTETATESDLPLLVKASAGGGGRGMRIVRSLADLADEIDKASSEAESAFGDGTVFVEPYVENSRHIEVQLVGDPVAGVQHVFGERDCSVQRRHQKVVEETPAPGLTAAQREALHEAARQAGAAIDYRGAGTVEFLVDADDPSRFFFLEMNTRLQVEHPVSECVTQVDLVEAQLAVAEGRACDVSDVQSVQGHAIEVRLYAEDPSKDWQPQSGGLTTLEFPAATTEFVVPTTYGIRLDSGFASGSEVSTHYDAMLAKVISWAATREVAIRQLTGALKSARIHGLTTNRDQLLAILGDEKFFAGEVSTALLNDPELSQPRAVHVGPLLCAATAALAEDTRQRRTVQQGIPIAFRNVLSQPQVTSYDVGGEEPHAVSWLGAGPYAGFPDADFEVIAITATATGARVDFVSEGAGSWADVTTTGIPGTRAVHIDSPLGSFSAQEVPRFVDPADVVSAGSLLAPMPGTVVRVAVEAGQTVAKGDPVLVLEAMKMQHTVAAPADGTVTEINVQQGTQVAAGEVLAVVSTDEDSDETQEGASA